MGMVMEGGKQEQVLKKGSDTIFGVAQRSPKAALPLQAVFHQLPSSLPTPIPFGRGSKRFG